MAWYSSNPLTAHHINFKFFAAMLICLWYVPRLCPVNALTAHPVADTTPPEKVHYTLNLCHEVLLSRRRNPLSLLNIFVRQRSDADTGWLCSYFAQFLWNFRSG